MHFPQHTTRADARYVPPFTYDCTAGHYVQADQPVDRCPACSHGEPCTGELHRVGKGSRTTVSA